MQTSLALQSHTIDCYAAHSNDNACILTPLRQTCVSELQRDPSVLGSGIGHLALLPVQTTVKESTGQFMSALCISSILRYTVEIAEFIKS